KVHGTGRQDAVGNGRDRAAVGDCPCVSAESHPDDCNWPSFARLSACSVAPALEPLLSTVPAPVLVMEPVALMTSPSPASIAPEFRVVEVVASIDPPATIRAREPLFSSATRSPVAPRTSLLQLCTRPSFRK